jgi:hypothetical protein
VNCTVLPDTVDGASGVICMEVNVAEVTVSDVVALIPLAGSIAVMVTLPAAKASVSPLESLALLMEAILELLEVHVTKAVISWVLLSE